MSDKTWIKIHTGLTNDPVHRARMGNRVWYFMWLVDHADWETGIVGFYTDKIAAEDMSLPEAPISDRTIERQRQELAEAGYITCHKGDQCQHVRIMKWRNPRFLNPPMINVPGDQSTWYATPRTPSRSNLRTPSIEDHSSTTSAGQLLERHFALMLGSIALEPWEVLLETYGTEEFETALIATVNEGGGRKMHIGYVRAILERRQRERESAGGEDVDAIIAAIEADVNG